MDKTMKKKMEQLKSKLMEIGDLGYISSLLNWDQSTYMPPGGAPARARQMALIGRMAHEKQTDAKLGKLLDALEPYRQSLPYDSDDASLLRVARRDFELAIKVPSAFMADFYGHCALSYENWTQARPANDFQKVAPFLEKTLDLSRQFAEYFPGYEHVGDPLINLNDEGMKASSVRALFASLRQQLVPIVKAISAQPPADDACVHRHFPESLQSQFGVEVITAYGYDFKRGRQDKTHHPFMTKFSLGDVRITTRFDEHFLNNGLFSTLHEAGHALYEQNINPAFEATPLGVGTSSGVHESQSRLWENLVGRSRPFWEFYYPKLQKVFPQSLKDVSLEAFYRAINHVKRSLIRTEADEVTYNLHVMIRFDLELQMLEGKLAVRDLPEAWNARYTADLGVTPPDHKDGVLQDVHWYSNFIGGVFQGYTLGNLIGVQMMEAAQKAHPTIVEDMGCGKFDALRSWLKDNVNWHGRKYLTDELVKRVTGKPLSIDPYIHYLKCKYGEIYQLS